MAWKNRIALFQLHKGKNVYFLSGVVIANAIAALLEGSSFAIMLLALARLSGKQLEILPQLSFSLLVGLAIFSQLLRSAFQYLAQTVATLLGVRIQMELEKKLFSHLFSFSYLFASSFKTGNLIEILSSPRELTQQVLTSFHQVIMTSLMMVALTALLLFISPLLTLLVVAMMALFILVQKGLVKSISKTSKGLAELQVDFQSEALQNLQALRMLHAFEKIKETLHSMVFLIKDFGERSKRLHLWNHAVTPLFESFGMVVISLTLIAGAKLLGTKSEGTLASLFTFLSITYRLSARGQILMHALGIIALYAGGMDRIAKFLQTEDATPQYSGRNAFQELQREIRLQNVSFFYPQKKANALENLSFSIQKGTTVALVGPSGAGKSTLLDLLQGLIMPAHGEIMIDGTSLHRIDLATWRSQLGIVSQDAILFNASIRHNLLYASSDVSERALSEVLEQIGLDQLVQDLPDGLETVIGERGYRLSGGQKQRIALARSLLKKPSILLLDEATSHLDNQSEAHIQRALEMYHGRLTILVVAHRLSTIRQADQILVLEHGKIVEQGTHSTLTEIDGLYQKLWSLQTQKHHIQM